MGRGTRKTLGTSVSFLDKILASSLRMWGPHILLPDGTGRAVHGSEPGPRGSLCPVSPPSPHPPVEQIVCPETGILEVGRRFWLHFDVAGEVVKHSFEKAFLNITY